MQFADPDYKMDYYHTFSDALLDCSRSTPNCNSLVLRAGHLTRMSPIRLNYIGSGKGTHHIVKKVVDVHAQFSATTAARWVTPMRYVFVAGSVAGGGMLYCHY